MYIFTYIHTYLGMLKPKTQTVPADLHIILIAETYNDHQLVKELRK